MFPRRIQRLFDKAMGLKPGCQLGCECAHSPGWHTACPEMCCLLSLSSLPLSPHPQLTWFGQCQSLVDSTPPFPWVLCVLEKKTSNQHAQWQRLGGSRQLCVRGPRQEQKTHHNSKVIDTCLSQRQCPLQVKVAPLPAAKQ